MDSVFLVQLAPLKHVNLLVYPQDLLLLDKLVKLVEVKVQLVL